MQNTLQPFLFESRQIRGEYVRLRSLLEDIYAGHAYTSVEKQLMAELVCATLLLSALLKSGGKFTLQLQSPGALKVAVVQVVDKTKVRAMLTTRTTLDSTNLLEVAKEGQLLVSMDHDSMVKPYQSYVGLNHASLAACLMDYFQQSEQLDTHLCFHVNEGEVTGLLLQIVPGRDYQEDWAYVSALVGTLTSAELQDLPLNTLLYRLFHEDTITLFPPKTPSFYCPCSREKMLDAAMLLGEKELHALLEKKDSLMLRCEFCQTDYVLTADHFENRG